jgi:hypothetical protein
VFQWDYSATNLSNLTGGNCVLKVWVPVCNISNGDLYSLPGDYSQLCGYTPATPGTCVDPSTVIIPKPPGPYGFFPPSPCWWTCLVNWDIYVYFVSTQFTCEPIYWRSNQIPAWDFTRKGLGCKSPTLSSKIWPGGGYLTVTA